MSHIPQIVNGWYNGLWNLIAGVVMIAGLLAMATGIIWVERRLLAFFQDRLGPNRVGPFGLLQPVADIIKLFLKEDWTPPFADRLIFIIAPAILVASVILAFAVVPVTKDFVVSNSNVGILFFLGMTSLGVYSVTLGGWASNNKYSLIGSLRAVAQMISYEVPLGLSLVGVVLLAGSLRLSDIVDAQRGMWYCVLQPVGFIIFLIAGIAEARRSPFDLPEADSEIVAGYHTEYSSMKFALFFMGEYLDVFLISAMATVLYLGGWLGPVLPGWLWFLVKMSAVVFLFIWLRAVLPRYRFDQLMNLGWKILIPLSLVNVLITGGMALALR